MPLPKSAIAFSRQEPGLSAQLKKTLFGSKRGPLDARQKKMAVLVGILTVVFGVVMFISFGGVGGSKAVAAENTGNDATAVTASTAIDPANWKSPQQLPADLRNATMPVTPKVSLQHTNATAASTDGLVVKGIVFSKNKPSAIINNEIYTVGQHVNGALITNITKESVEFEINGNRWSQQVQR
jgi:hypothetical protein